MRAIEQKRQSGEVTVADVFSRLWDLVSLYYVHIRQNLGKLTSTRINHDAHSAISHDIMSNYNVTGELSRLSAIPVMVMQGARDLVLPQILEGLGIVLRIFTHSLVCSFFLQLDLQPRHENLIQLG